MNSNKQKTKTNAKIRNLIIFFLLFLFVASYFLILPTIDRITKTGEKIIKEKINIEKHKIFEKGQIELKKELSKTEPKLKKLNNIYINTNRELELITTLENLASKNNINQKMDLNTPEDIKKSNKSLINITADGDFQSIVKYLADINSLNYYFNINSAVFSKNSNSNSNTLSSSGGAEQSETITLKISATTYWK